MPKLKSQSNQAAANVAQAIQKVLFSVPDAAVALSMGRTTVFNLIKEGHIKAVKVGKRRLVAATELAAYAARLQEGA